MSDVCHGNDWDSCDRPAVGVRASLQDGDPYPVCDRECPDWGDDCGDHDRMTVCRACCTEGDGWHTMQCADTHAGTGSRLAEHCPTVASLDRTEARLSALTGAEGREVSGDE